MFINKFEEKNVDEYLLDDFCVFSLKIMVFAAVYALKPVFECCEMYVNKICIKTNRQVADGDTC